MQPTPQPSFGPTGQPASSDNKKAKAKKKKSASASSNRKFLLIALFLGGLTLAAVLLLGTSQEPSTTYVLRAKVPVNAFEEVSEGMLEAAALPDEAVEPTAIKGETADEVLNIARGLNPDGTTPTDPARSVVGAFPLYPVGAGRQLSFDLFTAEGRSDFVLEPGHRLVSVQASTGTAVAGSLRVGDKVDVVAVSAGDGVAGIVAAEVEIKAIQITSAAIDSAGQRQASAEGADLSREDLLPRDPIPGTYVLDADIRTAVALSVADSQGDLYLLYRGPGAETSPVGVVSLEQVLCSTGTEDGLPIAGCSLSPNSTQVGVGDIQDGDTIIID